MSNTAGGNDLTTLSHGLQLGQLALDIIAGKVTALSEARSLIDAILADAGPIGDMAPNLTPAGQATADTAADAAELAKVGP